MPFTISIPNFNFEWYNLKLFYMKTLELNQMENYLGGTEPTDCFVRGVGITLTAIGGFFFPPLWGATAAITFTSGGCL